MSFGLRDRCLGIAVHRTQRSASCLALIIGGLLLSHPLAADPPSVSSLLPSGVSRGTEVVVKLQGKPGTAPLSFWSSSEGLQIQADEKPDQILVRATEAVAPGLHWLRLYNAEGTTSLRPFVVGALPEISETEPNQKTGEAADLLLPMTVNGVLAGREDVDLFAITLQAGQTLVASIDAAGRLGSPMDSFLQVLSPAGFPLAQVDDDRGTDPQLAFTARETGRHFVRVMAFPADPNSTIRLSSSPDYVYRLSLTTGFFAERTVPAAVQIGQPAEVSFFGWNPLETPPRLSFQPTELGLQSVWTEGLPRDVPVLVTASPVASEEQARTAPQPLPYQIAGKLAQPDEIDRYPFDGKKGQKLLLSATARQLGSPADIIVRLEDATGKVLQEVDDKALGTADTYLEATLPADGTYHAVVLERFQAGGPRYDYLISLGQPIPELLATVASDAFTVKAGETVKIPITLERRFGDDREWTFSAQNLPAGVTSTPATSSAKGDTSKSVTLELTTTKEALFAGPLSVIATTGTAEEVKTIPVTVSKSQPPQSLPHLWLTVTAP